MGLEPKAGEAKELPAYWSDCPICGRRIGARGQAGHMLAHVRRGEAVILPSITPIRWQFEAGIHEHYRFGLPPA